MRMLFHISLLFGLCVSSIMAQQQFHFTTDTSSSADYNLVHNAYVDTNTKTFVITDAQNSESGAVWFKQLIKLAAGFNVTFSFKITLDPSNTSPGCRDDGEFISGGDGEFSEGHEIINADGIAFVLNAYDPTYIGDPGEDLGYDFPNNFVVELDTYPNEDESDPPNFHLGIQSCGTGTNSADHAGPCHLAPPIEVADQCYDNVFHTVTVIYDAINHFVQVSYDGQLYYNISYNIGANLNLINGDSVYVGFTGSTGGSDSRQEFSRIDYTDLNQVQCPAGKLVNYTDNTCYTCPAGYFANFTINSCVAYPTLCHDAPTTVSTSDELQQALATTCNIIVAPGNYPSPSNNQGFKILINNTILKAQVSGQAIIDCGGSGKSLTSVMGQTPQISIGLYVAASNVEVSGFVLQHCQAGVYADWYAEATFTSMNVNENFNNIGIGSGFHTIYTSVIDIVNSVVADNTGYAGVFVHGTATISDSHVDNNSGGGVAARYSAVVVIMDSTIDNNYGSGIYAERNSHITVDDSSIEDNHGSYNGGGFWIVDSSLALTSSNVTFNSARQGGGGSVMGASTLVVTDSIIADNTATASSTGNNLDTTGASSSAQITITGSDVQSN